MDSKLVIHPVLLRKVNLVLAAMRAAGMSMDITPNPVRTAAEQFSLYQIGRTKPGRIVTNADGYHIKSNHQIKDDGFGHAVDCHFVIDGKAVWEVPDTWWKAYGSLAQAVGLTWGGNWKSFPDRPHVELPKVF